MKKNDSGLSNIIFPLLIIILLFFITIFIITLPYIRNSLVENEANRIKYLVEQQIQLLDSLNDEVKRGNLSIENAQKIALELLAEQRYGEEREFYYWVNDLQSVLLMHPFRPDLVNQYVGDYKDSKGNYLFSRMVEIVNREGEGYLEYVWQLPYEVETLIDKKSFVKLYEPWGWIVGTGFYIDILSSEIKNLFLLIYFLSVIVLGMIILISYYIIFQRVLLRRRNLFYVRNFRESEKRYKDLIGRMNEGFVLVNQDLHVTMANKKLLTMLGKTQQSVIGETMEKFIHKKSLETYRQNFLTRKEGENSTYEVDLKGVNNSKIPVIISPMGIFNENAEFIGSFAVFTDVSKLKNIQKELKISLKERDNLLQEIHHRVKNNLQIIISLLHLERIKAESAEFDKLLSESESRIFCISLVHELLYETQSLNSIRFGEYLDRILEHLRIEFVKKSITIQFENKLADYMISVDSSASAGIIFTELTMKFCGLFTTGIERYCSIRGLKIEAYSSDNTFKFIFTGSFNSIVNQDSIERCFDLNLVSILVTQLDGEFSIDFDKSGTRNEVEFSLVFPVCQDCKGI